MNTKKRLEDSKRYIEIKFFNPLVCIFKEFIIYEPIGVDDTRK